MLDNDTDRAKRLVNGILTRQPDGRELTDAETSELLSAYGVDVGTAVSGGQPRPGHRGG